MRLAENQEREMSKEERSVLFALLSFIAHFLPFFPRAFPAFRDQPLFDGSSATSS
jgi:hypothetical protein